MYRLTTWTGILLASVMCFGLTTAVLAGPAQAATFDWINVGDPGNAADTTGYGSVAIAYRISETEVTNAQYVEFLNAKAASDPNELYHTSMGSGYGGITRTGSAGSYSYSTIAGREDMPVNWIAFYDALRFVNWIHNGQGSGDTETGAYTITAAGISANSITRNTGASIFLTSEDEWYKAAYYDAFSTSYFDYPTGTDTATVCTTPGPTPNTANCAGTDVTIVGTYTGSDSPYGTFDQGGNVWEWNEAIIDSSKRGIRGGGNYLSQFGELASSTRLEHVNPIVQSFDIGFRVASPIPEPGTGLLLMTGMLGLASWRRRRA